MSVKRAVPAAVRLTLNLFPEDESSFTADERAVSAADAATAADAKKEAARLADKRSRKTARQVALVVLGDDPLAGPAAFGLAVLWPAAVGGPRLGVHGWHSPTAGRDAVSAWAKHLLASFERDWVRDEGWRADVSSGPLVDVAVQEAARQMRAALALPAASSAGDDPREASDEEVARALAATKARRRAAAPAVG